MGSWAPALRIARRTAFRSPGRTLLVAALIGVPVLAASWLGVMERTMNPTGETRAVELIGKADAQVVVTPRRTVSTTDSQVDDGTYNYTVDPSADQDDLRDPATVDLRMLLPPGTTLAARTRFIGTVILRTSGSSASYPVVLVDGTAGLSDGSYRLDAGQLPTATDEVALTPALAKHLGLLEDGELRQNATVTGTDGTQYRAVGLARTLIEAKQRAIWTSPGSKLVKPTPDEDLRYLAAFPAGTDLTALQAKLTNQGVVLTPRSAVVNPPPMQGGSTGTGMAVVALVISFGVLEIVLLAGTAFAVGARRQTRALGLVAAAGGTARDVRRIVLAQGVVIGLIGAVSGLLIAIIAAIAGQPLWERLSSRLITDWQLPIGRLVVITAIGAAAGLLAAIVPAHAAANRPPLAALAGRFTSSGTAARLRRPAILLTAGGVGSVLVGTSWLAALYAQYEKEVAAGVSEELPGLTPTGPIALILLGIICVIAGLIWLLPNLIARVATLGGALPLSGRLALRDAARHRHRTGPAAAAIMMSVAATAAMAFATANSFAADAEDYVPTGQDGTAIARFQGDNTSSTTGIVNWTAAMERNVADSLPAKGVSRLGPVHPFGARTERNGQFSYTETLVGFPDPKAASEQPNLYGLPLLAVDPDFMASLGGNGAEVAAALRAGKVIVPSKDYDENGTIRVGQWRDEGGTGGKKMPPAVLTPSHQLAAFERQLLVAADTAKTLGTVSVQQTHFDLTRAPTKAELAAAATFLGNEDALKVERGYESPANITLLILVSAAAVVTLLGVAISVSLSAAEGRADLATLAAVGAKPRQRRNLAGAQAWVLGQVGCLLGVGVGAIYGYTARVAFGSPYFAVPWREIGGIVLVVPVFAGLLAWLLTRSRLPMVSRID